MHRILFLLGVVIMLNSCDNSPGLPAPPESKREILTETLHGVEIEDPYRWLEDREAPETRTWIDAQMEYTRSILDGLPGRKTIEGHLRAAREVSEWSPPAPRRGRYFYERKSGGAQLSVIAMREGIDGEEVVLVDPHPMSADQTTSVHLGDVSADGRLLVYEVREGGEDEVVPRIFAVDPKRDLEQWPKARYGGAVFAPDGRALYYVRWVESGPRVYRHELGAPVSADRLLFGEGVGMDRWISVLVSGSGRYLLYTVTLGWDSAELYLQDRRNGGAPVRLTGGEKAYHQARFAGDGIIVATDWKAPNRRVLAASPTRAGIEHWKEIVPEGEYPIESGDLLTAGDAIVVHRRERAVSTLEIYSTSGEPRHKVEFDGPVSIDSVNGSWTEPDVFFVSQTFTNPGQVHRLHLEGMKESVWEKMSSPLFDGFPVAVKQIQCPSKDGTPVPMFIVHREGLELSGDHPTLLYGYGGFNVSLTPSFSPLRAVFVRQGGVLAVANLRGGGELGEAWHRAGMLANKQNVFDDFIAAAEWLIAEHYTNPRRLAIMGGSNGGLLVGAALTQRPDLFQAVVCSHPLLDMLRYHRFLLGELWTPEYGSAEDPEQFAYLRAYSPYHHVRKGAGYPAILFKTGDGDTRVAPLHARKMTALMQWATASEKPVLLHYDTKFGHSEGMPVARLIEADADVLQFLLWQLGALPRPSPRPQ